jgi:uncharacterized membrane protein YqjE
MNKIKFPLIATSLLLLLYHTLNFIGANSNLIILLFVMSPLAVIWMVYRVLKDGTPCNKTWDDSFYEDHSYRRNGKEEMNHSVKI